MSCSLLPLRMLLSHPKGLCLHGLQHDGSNSFDLFSPTILQAQRYQTVVTSFWKSREDFSIGLDTP